MQPVCPSLVFLIPNSLAVRKMEGDMECAADLRVRLAGKLLYRRLRDLVTKFAGQKIDVVPIHDTGEVRITVYLPPPPPLPPPGHGVEENDA